MAKITLENGMVLEGTPEELVELAKGFEAEEKPFEIGDYVKVTGDTRLKDIGVGSYAKIISDLDDDDEYQIELIDESDYDYAQAHVIEKVSEAEATREGFESANKPKEDTIKVGDYVKIIGNTRERGPSGEHRFEIGTIGKATSTSVGAAFGESLRVEYLDGHDNWVVAKCDAVLATEEEIAEATKPKTKFKVGDYVKAVKSNSGHVGKIFVVTKVFSEPEMYNGITYTFEAKSVDERDIYTAYSNEDRSVLATDEEIAAAKTEVKWAKIGRVSNEFKVGDIVRVDDTSAFGVNTFGEVVREADEDGDLRVEAVGEAGDEEEFFVPTEKATLVTPVEARFDR